MLLPLTAADQVLVASTNVAMPTNLVSLNEEIVSVQKPPLKIELTESVYQQEQKKRAYQARVATVSTASPEPTIEEKRAWVKRAAASVNIDWKLLEAVWQIESGKRWKTTVTSSAGAYGPCQFMPGTWRSYATDGNGDGVKDATDARDCLFGAAKLLARSGADVGDHKRALFSYNHSMAYVTKVLDIVAGIQG